VYFAPGGFSLQQARTTTATSGRCRVSPSLFCHRGGFIIGAG
jgi:hypothetical protein